MHLTPEKLYSLGACKPQADRFAALYPGGGKVTRALCFKHARDFDWNWAARNLLPAPAYRAYDGACASASRAYDEATAPARRAYNEACAGEFGRLAEEVG